MEYFIQIEASQILETSHFPIDKKTFDYWYGKSGFPDGDSYTRFASIYLKSFEGVPQKFSLADWASREGSSYIRGFEYDGHGNEEATVLVANGGATPMLHLDVNEIESVSVAPPTTEIKRNVSRYCATVTRNTKGIFFTGTLETSPLFYPKNLSAIWTWYYDAEILTGLRYRQPNGEIVEIENKNKPNDRITTTINVYEKFPRD